MTTETITFARGGRTVVGRLASEAELRAAADALRERGRNIDECECGDEICHPSGYIMRCALRQSTECRWFMSDVGCNP